MTGTDAVGKSIFESITHVLDRVSTGGGETNARLPRPARCGNDAPWKLVEKSYGLRRTRFSRQALTFPRVSTALGNPAKGAGFPHSHSDDGG